MMSPTLDLVNSLKAQRSVEEGRVAADWAGGVRVA